MKKMFRNIVPHIIPEFKLLLFRILPMGIVLAFFFDFITPARDILRDPLRVLLYGLLLSIAGIYLIRITAFVIKKVLCQIPYVIPDIFYDESKNNNA